MLYLCYFGAFINEYLTLVYSSIPLFIIRRFEFYRLITSLFITDSFLEVVYITFSILTIINFWENKEDIIGRVIEVKFKEITVDKKTGLESLQFPVFCMVREIGKEPSYN